MGFILTLNEGVKRKKLTCEYQVSEVSRVVIVIFTLVFVSVLLLINVYKFACMLSPCQTVEKLLTLLGTLDRWIDETPPVDQPSRFGNKAYRTWYAKLDQVST